MCDRYGCAILPDLKTLDFSRRNFLKATGLTTLTMAVGPGMLGQALAADTTARERTALASAISTFFSPMPCRRRRKTESSLTS
jgi:hypothetical protein